MNQAAIPYGLRDADLSAAEIKPTPVAADGLLLIDSDDNGSIKRVSPDSLGGGAENAENLSVTGTLNLGGITDAGCDLTVANGRLGLTRPTNSAISLGIDLASKSSVGIRINSSSGSSGGTQFGSFLGRSYRQYWTSNTPSDPGDLSIGRVASGIVDIRGESNTPGAVQAAGFANVNGLTALGGSTGVAFSGGVRLAPITRSALLATTPTADAGMFRITDQGNEPAYPDGTAWRSLATNQVIA